MLPSLRREIKKNDASSSAPMVAVAPPLASGEQAPLSPAQQLAKQQALVERQFRSDVEVNAIISHLSPFVERPFFRAS
jgi:hypothetical protein